MAVRCRNLQFLYAFLVNCTPQAKVHIIYNTTSAEGKSTVNSMQEYLSKTCFQNCLNSLNGEIEFFHPLEILKYLVTSDGLSP